MFYLGIDPGVSGGIAMLDERGTVIRAIRMPETEKDVLDALDPGVEHGICRHAVIERVGAFPGMGVVSAFTFGRGFGRLLMALTARRYPFDVVAPAVWQAALSCRSGGDKNITKRRAQQLFPLVTVTHALADALLITEFCRRTHGDQRGRAVSNVPAQVEDGRPKAKATTALREKVATRAR
jgi:hypothetical protein